MPALTNPLNSAECDWEYSTNSGGAWTAFDTAFGVSVLDAQPSEFSRKVIERRLLNVTRVQKYIARIDYGNLKIIMEYSSVAFTTILGWQTNKTAVWLRVSPEDTGGTNDSSIIYKSATTGGIFGVKPFDTPGDDQILQFEFQMAVDDMTFTAGA